MSLTNCLVPYCLRRYQLVILLYRLALLHFIVYNTLLFRTMALVLIVLAAALAFAFYLYSTWTFKRFEGTKIPHLKPFPVVGNMLKFFLKREDVIESFGKFYTLFPNDR